MHSWIRTQHLLVSIVVSIPACHAGDRGSIPRRGVEAAVVLPLSWPPKKTKRESLLEMPRIELGASYMRSMRSTTELHPLCCDTQLQSPQENNATLADKCKLHQRMTNMLFM